MEVAVARAFKPSLRREFSFQQAVGEEILCVNANNVVFGGGDDFSVDDLLDFSNGEFQHASLHYEQQQYSEGKDSSFFSSQSQDDSSHSNSAGVSIFSGELAVPDDDLAELEWVSQFVDDSIPELSLIYPVRPEQAKAWLEPQPRAYTSEQTPSFPSETKVPTKARSTKTRKPNSRACSFTPLVSRPSSPSSCSSSSTVQQPPSKRQKKRAEAQQDGGAQLQRRCSHCQVQKTPQWRTGPLGAKTLCNACGVRYKSGRLFAEYRPACSPTFSSEIHSNSHRKVLEIRRRKGMLGPDAAGSVHTQLVPGC